MSSTTALAVTPDRRPMELAVFRNSHGWAPSIWGRLLVHRGHDANGWLFDDAALVAVWQEIETLPEWQQVPMVLTFDTGVIPFPAYEWAADMLDEFERRLPAPHGHANHVPAMAALLRSLPEAPLFGVYGTSVSDNPFDPWDEEADAPGSGIPASEMYVLERLRPMAAKVLGDTP